MKKLLIAASMMALCSTAAVAHDRDMNDTDMMEKKASMMTNYALAKKDTNRDGFVSKAECDAAENRMFSKADANGDGALSGQEIMDAKYEEMQDMKMWMQKDNIRMDHSSMRNDTRMPMRNDRMPMRDDRDMRN